MPAPKEFYADSLILSPYNLTSAFLILSCRVWIHHRDYFSDGQDLLGPNKEAVATVVFELALIESGSRREKNFF
jgi:hypothetical protein